MSTCAFSCKPRTRNPVSTLGRVKFHVGAGTRHVPGWSTLGDQIGPVDIRGARPLHSGCCEAVLECAPHAVDSRIFGSKTFLYKKRNTIYLSYFSFSTCCLLFLFQDKHDSQWIASRAPLAELSAVNRQVLGSIPSGGVVFFLFFLPSTPGPIKEC